MLTVKGFESSGAAGKYYSHGDYYGSEGMGQSIKKGGEIHRCHDAKLGRRE